MTRPTTTASDASDAGSADDESRFEFRVWGEHPDARKLIRSLADEETREEFDDFYLIIDDQTFNAKVRDNTLKIKQLVSEDRGFESWTSQKHRSAKSVPSEFDSIYEALDLDRAQKQQNFNMAKAVTVLEDHDGVHAVIVTKRRRRYTLDELRAEVTDIEIHTTGEVLQTLSIDGHDLRELVKLRKTLGLKGVPNTAVHQYIENETDS